MSSALSSGNDDKMRFVSGSDFNQNLEQNLEGDLSTSNAKAKTPASLNVQMPGNQTSVNMVMTNQSEFISTLDEPISVTINRDLKAVCYKLGHVFFPKKR